MYLRRAPLYLTDGVFRKATRRSAAAVQLLVRQQADGNCIGRCTGARTRTYATEETEGYRSRSRPPSRSKRRLLSVNSQEHPDYLRYIHRAEEDVRPPPATQAGLVTDLEGASSGYEAAEGAEPRHAEDEKESRPLRPNNFVLKKYTAGDLLKEKQLLRQQLEVEENCTIDEAITMMVNQRVTSFVVVNRKREVVGFFTARDVLGELARYPNKAAGLKARAQEFMIPLNQLVFCSPQDNLYRCLLIMSELKIRNLPVVKDGEVMGIVNINDISDYSFSTEELGGKKAYIKNISERKGLPAGTGLSAASQQPSLKGQHISASLGCAALPHPFKRHGAVSASQRDHRHLEIASDPTLSEDAHFMLSVSWPTAHTDTVHYVGVADGVGSWRAVGVDPRDFSHRLMHWAQQYLLSTAPGPGEAELKPPPKPHQVLSAAWEMTVSEKVVGSSTACVATLDYELDQLTFSNIGDNGVVVLRHIDSDVAGYMREKQTPRHLRKSDLRLAFISQQQLRSFNLPYQFGYTNVPADQANFETPRDAVNTSFPVAAGDIIVIATDGLYDNMELDELCSLALEWEYKWFGGPLRGLDEHNNAAMSDLAEVLAKRARELSLDSTRDSPFALLAKENDIMWGGGMPDDVTVVCMRVIRKKPAEALG